jgi:hypothetical protein
MTTQCTLGPLMTLVLTLALREKRVAIATGAPPDALLKSFLFARILSEFLRRKPLGGAGRMLALSPSRTHRNIGSIL